MKKIIAIALLALAVLTLSSCEKWKLRNESFYTVNVEQSFTDIHHDFTFYFREYNGYGECLNARQRSKIQTGFHETFCAADDATFIKIAVYEDMAKPRWINVGYPLQKGKTITITLTDLTTLVSDESDVTILKL